jgi:hypothetical protein
MGRTSGIHVMAAAYLNSSRRSAGVFPALMNELFVLRPLDHLLFV